MFLSLMKYYRRAYLDLVREKVSSRKSRRNYQQWIERFFDCNEIALSMEWSQQTSGDVLSGLQETNRNLTNQKNKYVTIFESIPIPVVLLDVEGRCNNMNHAAQRHLLGMEYSPGYLYYAEKIPTAEETLPWLWEDYEAFRAGQEPEMEIDKVFDSPHEGRKILNVRFRRIRDVGGSYAGVIIIFTDFTQRKELEEQLRHMSYHDALTELFNRAFLDREIKRMSTGMYDPVGVVSCDLDCLKLVNDTLGHLAGDILITLAGEVLKSSFREGDVVARVGGDEFLIVVPNTDEEGVTVLCRRIREKVAEHNAEHETMPVSLSVGGAAGLISKGASMRSIIKKADDIMYAVKPENRKLYRELFAARYERYGQKLFQ
jgi:diguanylate cyclase (GGDEF)-like protein/PAS domain S-box-containing protein